MGVSFTLLLTYPYGNSSLHRKLGGLQRWCELASTETNPAGSGPCRVAEFVGAQPLIGTGALCVLCVSSNYTATVLLAIHFHTHSTQHIHINAHKAKRA